MSFSYLLLLMKMNVCWDSMYRCQSRVWTIFCDYDRFYLCRSASRLIPGLTTMITIAIDRMFSLYTTCKDPSWIKTCSSVCAFVFAIGIVVAKSLRATFKEWGDESRANIFQWRGARWFHYDICAHCLSSDIHHIIIFFGLTIFESTSYRKTSECKSQKNMCMAKCLATFPPRPAISHTASFNNCRVNSAGLQPWLGDAGVLRASSVRTYRSAVWNSRLRDTGSGMCSRAWYILPLWLWLPMAYPRLWSDKPIHQGWDAWLCWSVPWRQASLK